MLIHLTSDVGCPEITVHVASENHLGELSFSAVLLELVLPPVGGAGKLISVFHVIK